MSEKIDQFCENLRQQLSKAEGQLAKVGESLKDFLNAFQHQNRCWQEILRNR